MPYCAGGLGPVPVRPPRSKAQKDALLPQLLKFMQSHSHLKTKTQVSHHHTAYVTIYRILEYAYLILI